MSKSLKPRCPQRQRNRINPPSKSLEIFRIYFFLYTKKFDKKLGLINQPTATNGLIEVFPICCLCPFRAWQSWLWIKDLDFSLPLQLSYIKNKHCEVLVSCSDWVDLIDFIELHAFDMLSKAVISTACQL